MSPSVSGNTTWERISPRISRWGPGTGWPTARTCPWRSLRCRQGIIWARTISSASMTSMEGSPVEMESASIDCFKAYDVRGKVPEQLNADIACRIGRGFAAFLQPRKVVLGYDIRLTGPEMADAIAEGLRASGVDVHSIGL